MKTIKTLNAKTMKAPISLSAIFALGLLLISCEREQHSIVPSGDVTIIEKNITGFDALDVSDNFTVFVQFSDSEESVRIEADDNFSDHIVVEKIGSTLHIGLEGIQSIRGQKTLNDYVTTATLKDIEVSGDSEVRLGNELQNEQVKVNLSGDSQLQGHISANRLEVSISGDSKMTLDNMMQGESAFLTLRGDSEFEGSFDVITFDALVTGDSRLDIIGEADIAKIEAKGSSEVRSYNFAIKSLDIILASDFLVTSYRLMLTIISN